MECKLEGDTVVYDSMNSTMQQENMYVKYQTWIYMYWVQVSPGDSK